MVRRELLDVEIIAPDEAYTWDIMEDIKTPLFYYEMNLKDMMPRLQLNIEQTWHQA
jgi:hypothetical protein